MDSTSFIYRTSDKYCDTSDRIKVNESHPLWQLISDKLCKLYGPDTRMLMAYNMNAEALSLPNVEFNKLASKSSSPLFAIKIVYSTAAYSIDNQYVVFIIPRLALEHILIGYAYGLRDLLYVACEASGCASWFTPAHSVENVYDLGAIISREPRGVPEMNACTIS